MPAFVYIVECSDGSYYVGSAGGASLDKRIEEHNAGHYEGYTSRRLPVTLVFSEQFMNITDAIAAERQLKGWSRAKKEALIAGNTLELKKLSSRAKKSRDIWASDPSRRLLRNPSG